MKLRKAIASAAIVAGCSLGSLTATAGASLPPATPAVQAFWQNLYNLEHYPYQCVAYTANIVGNGVGGDNPDAERFAETPVYGGNCAQAFVMVLDHSATFYTVVTN